MFRTPHRISVVSGPSYNTMQVMDLPNTLRSVSLRKPCGYEEVMLSPAVEPRQERPPLPRHSLDTVAQAVPCLSLPAVVSGFAFQLWSWRTLPGTVTAQLQQRCYRMTLESLYLRKRHCLLALLTCQPVTLLSKGFYATTPKSLGFPAV